MKSSVYKLSGQLEQLQLSHGALASQSPVIKFSRSKENLLPLKPSKSKASLVLSLKQDSALLDLENKWMMGQLNTKDLVQIMAKDSLFCEKLFQTPQVHQKLSNEVMTYLVKLHPWIAIKVIEDEKFHKRVPHDVLNRLAIHDPMIATAILKSEIKYPKFGIMNEMIVECAEGNMSESDEVEEPNIGKPIEKMAVYEMEWYARQSNQCAMELLGVPSARAELIRQFGIIDTIAYLYREFALMVIQDSELSRPLNGLSIVAILQVHPDLFPYVVENLHCLDKLQSKDLKNIALRDDKAAAVILNDKELFSILELKDRVSLAKRYYQYALKVYPDSKLLSWQKRSIAISYLNSAKQYLLKNGLNQENLILLSIADDFPHLGQWMLSQDKFSNKLGDKSVNGFKADMATRDEVIGLIREYRLEQRQSASLSCQS